MNDRFWLGLRRFELRTSRGPLRPLWSFLYRSLLAVLVVYLRRGRREVSAYARGSFGWGSPVYGLSDIDLTLVTTRDSEAIRARWQRLAAAVPSLGRLLSHLHVCEDSDVVALVSGTYLTFPGQGSLFGERPVRDGLELQRPGLDGPTRDWRLVAGRERRPPLPPLSDGELPGAAWLELQYWWRQALFAILEPPGLELPLLCVKLIAEPARIWLRLAGIATGGSRSSVLEGALRRLPDEEVPLALALRLERTLHRSPSAQLGDVLPFLVRQSERIASAVGAGATPVEVKLVSTELPAGLLPLVDWRARALPRRPDEAFSLRPGEPEDPAALEAAALEDTAERASVLRRRDLLVLPARRPWVGGALRAVQCATTDPVSLALLEGAKTARFPDLPGWSASDSARRAAAEHRGWLALRGRPPASRFDWAGSVAPADTPTVQGLGLLLTAARAAYFEESIERGAPELLLTPAAIAERLAEPGHEALIAYREGVAPEAVFNALRARVLRLPAYR